VNEFLRSVSPADPGDEIGRFPVWDPDAVDEAIRRARAAFPAWRDAGFEVRAATIRRFRDLAARRREELAELIAREVGKAIWEARSEADLLPAKVDVTLAEGMRFAEPMRAAADAWAGFHARGVLAVLGPFNFPAHLPSGHIIPALATGNAIVFKPSEMAPAVGDWLGRMWRDAGLPRGVLETVQGRAETGRDLALHPGADGILFTGSYAVGRSLQQQILDQPGKILALEMGGKNAMIVLDDADLELTVSEAAISICATTGQRCTSLSRIFVARSRMEEFAERLSRVLAGVRVGPPLEPDVFMGPLVSRAAFEKVMRYRGQAAAAGGERIFRGQMDRLAPYIAPSLVRFRNARQTHPYQRDEIFGPEAALYPVSGLDEAIAAVNDADYGLAASVMSRDRSNFDYCIGRIRTGVLNWNRGTVGASGKLPFGGLGRSGNDRPAGVLSTTYCTFPQSHLENDGRFDPEGLPPGMPRP
jgi:succinylglutamic semialdehyde dehydrogenase